MLQTKCNSIPFHFRSKSNKVKVPQDMADAILRVGRVQIKNTSMSYETFYCAVRKRFSSGRLSPGDVNHSKDKEASDNTATSKRQETVEDRRAKEGGPPSSPKKTRERKKKGRNQDATTSESDSVHSDEYSLLNDSDDDCRNGDLYLSD